MNNNLFLGVSLSLSLLIRYLVSNSFHVNLLYCYKGITLRVLDYSFFQEISYYL